MQTSTLLVQFTFYQCIFSIVKAHFLCYKITLPVVLGFLSAKLFLNHEDLLYFHICLFQGKFCTQGFLARTFLDQYFLHFLFLYDILQSPMVFPLNLQSVILTVSTTLDLLNSQAHLNLTPSQANCLTRKASLNQPNLTL